MVEAEPPAQAPALEDPQGFDTLSDDLVLRACLRAPFVTHGSLHAVCQRFKSLLRSDDFRKQRLEYGLVEYGVVVAGGWRDDCVTADCWMRSEGRWRPIPPMSSPRSNACSVIIDNEMWVMGGLDSRGNAVATVEVYSPKTNSWRSCTPMSQRRGGAVAGVVGGRLVVAGGCSHRGDHLSSVEAYTGNGWTPLPPMPHEACWGTACVLNGRLYVMGGHDSSKLQVLEMTEEHGLSWSCKADLPAWAAKRSGAASVVHEGKIWVMGGHRVADADPVIIYDPETDAWGTGPQPAFRRWAGRCTAVTIEGSIFLFDARGPRDTSGFVYSNAAWDVVVVWGARRMQVWGDVVSEHSVCGSLLLG